MLSVSGVIGRRASPVLGFLRRRPLSARVLGSTYVLAEVDRAARVRGAYGELPTDMTLQFHGRPAVIGQPHTTITLAPLLAWQVCAGSGRTRGMTL